MKILVLLLRASSRVSHMLAAMAIGAIAGYLFSEQTKAGPEEQTTEKSEAVPVASMAGDAAAGRGSECVLCLSNASQYACMPCGHLCICSDCARGGAAPASLSKCPVCRRALASRQLTRIYS